MSDEGKIEGGETKQTPAATEAADGVKEEQSQEEGERDAGAEVKGGVGNEGGDVSVEVKEAGGLEGEGKMEVKDGGGLEEEGKNVGVEVKDGISHEEGNELVVEVDLEASEKPPVGSEVENQDHSPAKEGNLKTGVPPEGEGGEPLEVTPEEPTSEDTSKAKGKKAVKRKPVSVWKLFRFADFWDAMMILLGFVCAVASGVALPGHMLLFGRVINNFVYYSTATNCTQLDDGTVIPSLSMGVRSRLGLIPANFTSCEVDTSCPDDFRVMCNDFVQYSSMFIIDAASQGNASALLCDIDTGVFENVAEFLCCPGESLQESIRDFSLIYVGMATAVLIVFFLSTIFWNVSAYRQTRRIRQAFYRSVLYQDIGWFDVTEPSELSTRLSDDIEKIQSGIGDKVSVFLNYFSTFLAGFLIAYTLEWRMALVVSVILPILSFMAAMIAKIVATFTVREQGVYAAAGAVAEEVLSSIRTVVAFGGEKKEAQRYNEQLLKARREGIKKGFFSSLVFGLLYFVIFTTYALAFWYGSTLIVDCELSAGDVVTVFFAVILGSFSLGNALPELITFGAALGAASVIYEIIDRKPVIDASSSEGEIPDKLEGNIKFSDIVFHYPARPSVQVLKGLDVEIKNGQTVALVGPSGCGKSTVIQLLQRFYNPNGGLITLDGRDISTLNLQWLRRNIGVVSQEPVLFDTTIAENIRYGREDATRDDIIKAAKNANAHDFISQLPNGYDTDVGERGAQLSGGQKQRIAIARALVRDPRVLLLDEATSALDNKSEKVVQEALDKARQGRTTIVIAHRLSTIQNADTIVSIESGRVAERGSHAELMDLEGLYYELVTAQTIIEEADEQPTEGLAGFRAALKRTISAKREDSVSSGSVQPYKKQQSVISQHTFQDDAFGDHTSLFSAEDIPVASSPSPFPTRRFPVESERPISQQPQNQEEVEEVVEEVLEEVVEEGGKTSKKRSSTLKRLVKRRRKVVDAEAQSAKEVSFRELLALNRPDWYLVLPGVVFNAIVGILFPLMAVLFSEVLLIFGLSDREAIEQGTIEIAGGFIGLAVFSGITYFLATFLLSIAGEKLTKRLRYKSFQAMLKQEIGWFDQKIHSTGALATRLATDAAEVKGATGIRLGAVLQTIFGLLAAVVIAFEASWELSLLMIVAFPIIGSVSFLQIRLLAGRAQKNKKRLEHSGQTAVESIDNIRTVAGLGVEEKFYNRYSDLLSGPFRDNLKSVFLQAVVLSLSQSLVFYLYSAGFSFGAFLVIEGRAVYDDIFQVFAAVVFTALSLGRASSFAPDATKAKISASRILALLDRRPLIDVTSPEGLKLEKTSGDIKADSIHFNYPARPEVKVLQGLSVGVKSGQTLALVGPSGCGKSTIVSLVERFYDPVLGSLTLEGHDLRDLNLSWLRSQIGIVSQEPVLFDASIKENIRYGALFRDVSDEEIVEAAKSANIHSFIEGLPQGYETNVGAKGTQLSGGQKQRIAIARALIRDPKVLLLDEATSALDTESEKVVQKALDKAREGRTSIVIAHRLSTIYNSDVIAVIHNGQVIESGTHTELMAQQGAYYLLNTIHDVDDIQEL